MTKEEFFADLAKYTKETDTHWSYSNYLGMERIRCGKNGFDCPISFVATHKTGKQYNSSKVWDAANAIKLNRDEAAELVYAADQRDRHYSVYLRDRLLEATQLELR